MKSNKKKNDHFLSKLILTLISLIAASAGLFVYVFLEVQKEIPPLEILNNGEKSAVWDWKNEEFPLEIKKELEDGRLVSILFDSNNQYQDKEKLYFVFAFDDLQRSQNTITKIYYLQKSNEICYFAFYDKTGPLQYERTEGKMYYLNSWKSYILQDKNTIVVKKTCLNSKENTFFEWWENDFERVPLLSINETCFVDLSGTCYKRRLFQYVDKKNIPIVCDKRFQNKEYLLCN